MVGLSPENFDVEDLLQLQLILKRNNISLAKQFFIQNRVDPNELLDPQDPRLKLLRWWRALASRTQTRKKTRPSAEKSVAEGSGSRRQTITKINSGKTAATSSSTETKLDGEPVLRRQTKTRSKTKPAPAEVVELVPAARQLTRTEDQDPPPDQGRCQSGSRSSSHSKSRSRSGSVNSDSRYHHHPQHHGKYL